MAQKCGWFFVYALCFLANHFAYRVFLLRHMEREGLWGWKKWKLWEILLHNFRKWRSIWISHDRTYYKLRIHTRILQECFLRKKTKIATLIMWGRIGRYFLADSYDRLGVLAVLGLTIMCHMCTYGLVWKWVNSA